MSAVEPNIELDESRTPLVVERRVVRVRTGRWRFALRIPLSVGAPTTAEAMMIADAIVAALTAPPAAPVVEPPTSTDG